MNDNLSFIVFAVSLIAILVVAVRQNLFKDIDDMARAIKIGKHNVEYRLSPDRSIPIVISDKELGLQQLYPEFFNRFDRQDWDDFWDIIYGFHPLISFNNEKLPAAERNYQIPEIQKVLIERYPEAFAQFNNEQWRFFWKEIFGIIDYKIQSSSDDEWMRKQKDRSDRRLDRKMDVDNKKISETIAHSREEIGQ